MNMASAQAQKKKHAFYVTGAFNLGNYFGTDLNLNYVLKEKYTFKIGYTGNRRTAMSIPEDYRGRFLSFNDGPCEHIGNYRFDVGRIYKLNPSGSIRINAAVGLGYTTFTEPVNWKKKKEKKLNPLLIFLFPLFLFDGEVNYSWNYKSRNTIGLIINPKIEFAFTGVWGITISPMVQINRHRTYFGIGMGMMLGVIR